MIKSLWIIGILIAFSIFGVKVGLGASAIIYNGSISVRKKFFFLSGSFLIYLLLFFSLYTLTMHFGLLEYLDRFLKVLRYGMLAPLFIASGFLIWGVRLLLFSGQHSTVSSQRAAFFLIFPCPVCATVILFTLSPAYSLFSFPMLSTTGLLFGIFLSISLVTIFILFPFRRQIGTVDSSFLGLVMAVVALYFFLTVIIAPIYQEAQDIYHLASQSTGNTRLDLKPFWVLLVTGVALFSVGFFRQYIQKNKF